MFQVTRLKLKISSLKRQVVSLVEIFSGLKQPRGEENTVCVGLAHTSPDVTSARKQ